MTRVEIHSFGYLHEPPGSGLVVDLRQRLRDPHVDPAMRALTGMDRRVQDHVLTHPSALDVVAETADQVTALLTGYANSRNELVRVWIGCQGGRHRSVVIADRVAAWLREQGVDVDVIHNHVERPVVDRSGTTTDREPK